MAGNPFDFDQPPDPAKKPARPRGPLPAGMIAFPCHQCGREMRVGPDRAGDDVRCRGCDEVTTAPGQQGAGGRRAQEGMPEISILGWVLLILGGAVSLYHGSMYIDKSNRVVPIEQLAKLSQEVDRHGLFLFGGCFVGGLGFLFVTKFGPAETLKNRVRQLLPLEGRSEAEVFSVLGEPAGFARKDGHDLRTWKAHQYSLTLSFHGGTCVGVVEEHVG